MKTEDKKKPRVLITYIESGMGHIMSARSISDALKRKYGKEIEIVESNIMKDDQNPEQIKFEKFLVQQTRWTNKSKTYGFFILNFLEVMGKQKFMRFVHSTFFRKARNATIEAMKKLKPDCIISTHYFITYCAVELKKKYMPDLTVITYNPDNNVHVWWDNRSQVFINNNELAMQEAVLRRKFKETSLREVYFTARESVVNANESREFYRKKYDLPIDNFTVAVADGAYASAKAKSVTNELLKTNKKITIILIAGKNKKVEQYFIDKINSGKIPQNITFRVYPFMQEAYELYGAADLFITKAGPNAILDSLFMGTPVIVDCYAHPIEKATTKLFVDEYGCGEKDLKKKKVKAAVEHIIDTPEILENYRKNLKRIDKNKNGSSEIADIIIDELRSEGKI